ncbi:OmpW/AlkL family protein [Coralloluteibacterium thermophilus]|uniref:OmpW family protein n=1 Tax=Coralloluteibacterium thermophilum TaxID=2707049 RepID=A0ABV9NM45_9GAMM
MSRTPLSALIVVALAAAGCIAPAHAVEWSVRTGATHVSPKSDNGRLAGGTLAASVDDETQLGLAITARLTPHWAIELLAATPFHQTARVNGADAVNFRHLPPTLTAQYHFAPSARVSPFLGAGINYTWTYDEEAIGPLAGADVRLGNSWGASAQAGLVFRLSDTLDLVADARWIDIGADVRVDGTKVGTVDVDPMVYSVMLGWRF